LQANEHALLTHVAVACATDVVHTLLHVLQFFESLVGSTHDVPQRVGVFEGQPDAHMYELPDPAQLGVPPAQAIPHAPQLLAVSTGVSHPLSGPPLQCA
jgi:hypothetical protein